MTEETYGKELVAFEPKMRGMVRNFRRCGYGFDGHEDDDLVQEMFLRSLEVRLVYDPRRAGLRTFWYRCYRTHLVTLADNGKKALLWTLIDSCPEFEIVDPVFVEPNAWRLKAINAVNEMLDVLRVVDYEMASICRTFIRFGGDKTRVSLALDMPVVEIDYALTRLRGWAGVVSVLDCIPF